MFFYDEDGSYIDENGEVDKKDKNIDRVIVCLNITAITIIQALIYTAGIRQECMYAV